MQAAREILPGVIYFPFMANQTVHYAPNGRSYLNTGCGQTYSVDWNNLDRTRGRHIVYHDLRKPLPYPENSFDAVYSSHFLEHLGQKEGDRFLGELFRTCKPGGICRIVVPDYEQVCKEYLRRMEAAAEHPDRKAIRRYHWAVLEMIDQFTREKSGGRMLETLASGDFDEEYVRFRNGEEFSRFYSPGKPAGKGPDEQHHGTSENLPRRTDRWFARPWKAIPSYILSQLSNWLEVSRGDPRETGETHRWIYDRFGLKLCMEAAGFEGIERMSHDKSSIPDWPVYSFDSASDRLHARKPDSLYMEGTKPVPRKMERSR